MNFKIPIVSYLFFTMKYFANYNANNGTRFQEPIEGTNKDQIIKDIREIAEGNRFDGSTCSWEVWTENGKEVASGGCNSNGRRYRNL